MDTQKQMTKRLSLHLYIRDKHGAAHLAPPGIPKDRAEALQAAFMATMNDPKFQEDAKKQKLTSHLCRAQKSHLW